MLRLRRLWFKEFEGLPLEWTLDGIAFGNFNLVVGKNATGKTRTLNVINGLADFLSGRRPNLVQQSHYEAQFVATDGAKWTYEIKFRDFKIVKELLARNEEILLDRGEGGVGTIQFADAKIITKFQSPDDRLAVVARQDKIQHPFLEEIVGWATHTYHYAFSDARAKETAIVFRQGVAAAVESTDIRDAQQILGLFIKARTTFGEVFDNALISDMKAVGYDIGEIGLVAPQTVVPSAAVSEARFIYVQEADLPGKTDQMNMSAGMWRALVILIHLNYGLLSHDRNLLLIDDIGEGLDFERSANLVRTIVDRVGSSNDVQVIMTSNDRFIMNAVPLTYWQVLSRKGSVVTAYNYENAKAAFDAFRFTGLSNFDFLARDFVGDSAAE